MAQSFERAGIVYTSAGYARVGSRIDLRVSGGSGAINIQQPGGD